MNHTVQCSKEGRPTTQVRVYIDICEQPWVCRLAVHSTGPAPPRPAPACPACALRPPCGGCSSPRPPSRGRPPRPGGCGAGRPAGREQAGTAAAAAAAAAWQVSYHCWQQQSVSLSVGAVCSKPAHHSYTTEVVETAGHWAPCQVNNLPVSYLIRQFYCFNKKHLFHVNIST